jgi:hydrogenase maturation protease
MADLSTICVVGCGNPNRSDDGAGVDVVRRLGSRTGLLGPQVKLLDAGTDGLAVMFAARGCHSLVIVDACSTGGEPGTLFELPAEVVAAPHRPSYTLHDFRWDHALYTGKQLLGAEFPTDITVLLIEAGSMAVGLGLSHEVHIAVTKAVARIEQLLSQRGGLS